MIEYSEPYVYRYSGNGCNMKIEGKYVSTFSYSDITYIEAVKEVKKNGSGFTVPELMRLIVFDTFEDAIMFKMRIMPN